MLCLDNPKEYKKKLLALISEFRERCREMRTLTQQPFLYLLRQSWFLPFTLLMWCTDSFADAESFFHLWNKSHWSQCITLFKILLNTSDFQHFKNLFSIFWQVISSHSCLCFPSDRFSSALIFSVSPVYNNIIVMCYMVF